MIDKLVGLLGGNVFKGVKSVATLFTSDKEADANRGFAKDMAGMSQSHEAKMSAMDFQSKSLQGSQAAFVAEWNASQSKTGFLNALADFLNRLPRPLMALGVIGMFTYAMVDPVGATASFMALGVIPLEMWGLLSAVVSFYFVAREFQKGRQAKTANEVMKIAENISKVQGEVKKGNPVVEQWASRSNP